ncbi:MAG TPA: hypothetical protein VHZ99_13515 [Steroidobacteraceae bacterium]|jgi:hypothetical protein|nr:hypothetical protein [Steroidobacteraceae bacterium]
MSIGIANTSAQGSGTNAASLSGQIRQIKQQLDDWTTCVSAKTTKGQAEIQRLSGQMSAATQQLHRLSAEPSQSSQATSTSQATSASPARLLDVWA